MKSVPSEVPSANGTSMMRLLNASEVADVLNISKAFAYKLMQTGQLTTVYIGASRRVRMPDLEDFILKNTQPQGSQFGIK